MAKGFAKPKNVGKTFARLFGYLRPHIGKLVVVALLLLVNSLSGVIGTYLLKPIFNIAADMFKTGSRDFGPILRNIFLLAGVYVAGVAANYGVNYLLMKMNTRVLCEIRCEMFEHLEKLPLKYFDSRTHGEIMSRFTNDTDTLREMMSNALPNMISSTVTLFGVLVAMFLMNWKLTLLVLSILFIMTILVGRLTKLSAKYFRARQAAIAAASGYVEEHFEGQREVKVFCHEDKVKTEFGKLAQNLRDAAAKANSYGMILMPIMGNTSYILFAVSAMSGTSLIIRGLMDIGTLAAFLQYSKQIARPINMISQQVTSVLNALAGAERIFDLMDTEPEVDEGKYTLEKVGHEQWAWVRGDERIPLRGDVRFDGVTFSYDGKVDVLKDLSLYAKPGQKIAFVGSTGAVLRRADRGHHLRRHQREGHQKGRPQALLGYGASGHPPLYRHGHGEHPLRPPGRHGRGLHRRRQAEQRPLLHLPPARGVQHGPHRRRREPQSGPAAAHRHRPGRRSGPAGADPGRGHQLHRYPHRGPYRKGHGRAHEGADRLRHRP